MTPRIRIVPLLLLAVLSACQRARSAEPAEGGAPMSRSERRAVEGRIVFVSERDGQAEVYAVRPGGGPAKRITSATSADYPAAVSPDGSAVLVVSVTGDEKNQSERMALVPLDGSPARPLGPVSARVRMPSWSPDGRWMVFESDTASFRDLYRIDLDGSGLRRLTDDPRGNFEPAVSPDGQSIAFVSSRDGDAEVYVMRADGSEQRRLTAFHTDDWAPTWSPDGRTIAFLSNRDATDRVYLIAADGTDLRPLSRVAVPGHHASEPAWSPDGSKVAHTVRVPPTDSTGAITRIVVANVRTGERRIVSSIEESASAAVWSPDGRYLAYTSSREGESNIRMVRADGTASADVVRTPGPDWLPRWTP